MEKSEFFMANWHLWKKLQKPLWQRENKMELLHWQVYMVSHSHVGLRQQIGFVFFLSCKFNKSDCPSPTNPREPNQNYIYSSLPARAFFVALLSDLIGRSIPYREARGRHLSIGGTQLALYIIICRVCIWMCSETREGRRLCCRAVREATGDPLRTRNSGSLSSSMGLRTGTRSPRSFQEDPVRVFS